MSTYSRIAYLLAMVAAATSLRGLVTAMSSFGSVNLYGVVATSLTAAVLAAVALRAAVALVFGK